MIKTGTIKVRIIKNEEMIIAITMIKIMKTLIMTITIIIMMMMMRINIGNYQLPVGIINFDSYFYHYYYYPNLLFTVQADVRSLLSNDAAFNQ